MQVKVSRKVTVEIPTVMSCSETGTLSAQERRKTEVFRIMYLRDTHGLRRNMRVRNVIIRDRGKCKFNEIKIRVERSVLK